ncbi:hypothetical protein HAX54_012799 [Datura stramonium]|uniref:Uncharacterized protein n=1 Tax=Datura stramonium TaxID=4076 RepID=A0ABS8TM55_DATST|nr:hypothetical protein [Datura stramonium]
MAPSTNSLILSLKVVLISIGVEVKPVLVNGSVVVVNHEDEDVNDGPDESDAIVISKTVVAPLPEIETVWTTSA